MHVKNFKNQMLKYTFQGKIIKIPHIWPNLISSVSVSVTQGSTLHTSLYQYLSASGAAESNSFQRQITVLKKSDEWNICHYQVPLFFPCLYFIKFMFDYLACMTQIYPSS